MSEQGLDWSAPRRSDNLLDELDGSIGRMRDATGKAVTRAFQAGLALGFLAGLLVAVALVLALP